MFGKSNKPLYPYSALIELFSLVLSPTDHKRIISQALRDIRKMLNVKTCWMFSVEDDKIRLESLGDTRKGKNLVKSQMLPELSPQILKRIYPIICNRIGQLYKGNRVLYKFLHARKIQKFIGVPLKKEGKLLGALNVARDASSPDFSKEDLTNLVMLGNTIIMAKLRHAEDESKQSQKFLETIINNIPNPIFIKDRKHRWVVLNQAVAKLAGYSKKEMLGKSDYDFFSKEQADYFWKKDEEMFRTGKVIDIPEEPITDKEGNIHYLHTKKAPLKDSSGRITHLVGIIEDITEQRRADKTLQDSESKYRTLLENLPQRIFFKDKNSVYISCNNNFARDLNIETNEITGKTDYDFFPKKLAQKYKADDKRIIEFGRIEDIEEEYIKGGRKTFVHTVKTPIKGEDGNIIGVLGIFWDITECKLAQEAVRTSEETTRALLNASPDVALLIDSDGTIFALSIATARILGMDENELIGKCAFDLLPPQVSALRKTMTQKVIRSGKPIRFEDQQEGTWWDSNVYPVFDERGKVSRLAIFAYEITERKRAEEALKISQERYALCTRAANAGVWDWNIKTNKFYLDPSIKEILGYKDEEIPNDIEIWITYVHPGDREPVMEAAQACIDGKTPEYLFEHRMMHKDGSIRWILSRGSVIRDTKGKVVRMVGTDTDITERKRAEKAQQESEQMFRTIVETAPSFLTIYDINGKNIYVSPNCDEVTGYKREELMEKVIWWTHDDDTQRSKEALKSTISTGKGVRDFEYKLVKKNGNVIYASSSWEPVKNEYGKITQIIMQTIDITERKRTEDVLIRNERIAQQRAQLMIDLRKLNQIDDILSRVCKTIRDSALFERAVMTLHDSKGQIIHLGQVGLSQRIVQRARQAPPMDNKLRYKITNKKFRISDSFFIPTEEGVDFSHIERYIPQKRKKPLECNWQPGDELFVPLHDFTGKIMGYLSVDTPTNGCRPDMKTIQSLEMMVEAAASRIREVEAQKALRQESDFSQSILETANSLIVCLDAAARIIVFNQECEKVTGYRSEEVIGKGWPELFLPRDQRHPELNNFAQWVRAHPRDRYEGPIITKSGERKTILWSNTAILGSGDKDMVAIAIGHDITERKRAEEALRESEERYRSLFEDSPISLWEEDFSEVKNFLKNLQAKGVKDFRKHFENHPEDVANCASMVKVMDINKAGLELFKAKNKRELQGGLDNTFSEESYDAFKEELLAITRGESMFETEAISQTLNGHKKNVMVRWSVAPGYEKTLSKVLVSISDVTELKKAKEQNLLLETSKAVSRTLKLGHVLKIGTERIANALRVDRCSIALFDKRSDSVEIRHTFIKKGSPTPPLGKRTPPDNHFYQLKEILQREGFLCINKVETAPLPTSIRNYFRKEGIKSSLIIPLLVNKKLFGVFHAVNVKESRSFTSEEISMARTLANQVAVATQNSLLIEDLKEKHSQIKEQSKTLERQYQEQAILMKISRELSQTLDLERILQIATKEVIQALQVDRCAVALAFPEDGYAEIRSIYLREGKPITHLLGYKLHNHQFPQAKQMFEKRKFIDIPNIHRLPDKSFAKKYFMKEKIKSALFIPMLHGKKLVGFFTLSTLEDFRTFTQEEKKLTQTIADQVAVAIENARLLELVRKSEESLKKLSAKLIDIQEDERKKIAQELHDEVGQILQLMKMNLDRIKKDLSYQPHEFDTTREWLLDTEKMLSQTIDDIRTLTFELRPSMLDDLGLITTLRSYIYDYSRRSNIKVHLKVKEKIYRFPQDIEVALYRITQELLTNVAKHAQATEVSILVSKKKDKVILSVRDNGIGFDTNKILPHPRGMGLLNIKERVRLLGGNLEIISRLSKGSRININIPFSEVKYEEDQIAGR